MTYIAFITIPFTQQLPPIGIGTDPDRLRADMAEAIEDQMIGGYPEDEIETVIGSVMITTLADAITNYQFDENDDADCSVEDWL